MGHEPLFGPCFICIQFLGKIGQTIGWCNPAIRATHFSETLDLPLISFIYDINKAKAILLSIEIIRHDSIKLNSIKLRIKLSFSGRRILEVRRMVWSSKTCWCKSYGHKPLHRNPCKVTVHFLNNYSCQSYL